MSSVSWDALHTRGWQLVKGFVPPAEVVEIRDFLSSKVSGLVAEMHQAGVTPRDEIASIGRMLEQPGLDRELAMVMTGHFPLSVRLDPILQRVGRAPSVQALLKEVLGARSVRMHLPPAARFVLPGNIHAAVPAHQDSSYNAHLGKFVTVWTTYATIDEQCGGMAMFDGSSKQSMDYGAGVFWQTAVDTSSLTRVICAPMEPGDALVFHPWVVHESMPNHSDRIRLSVDFRFFGESSTSTKHYLDLESGVVVPPQ